MCKKCFGKGEVTDLMHRKHICDTCGGDGIIPLRPTAPPNNCTEKELREYKRALNYYLYQYAEGEESEN